MKINKYQVGMMLGYEHVSKLQRNTEVMAMAKLDGRTHYWESEDVENYIKERNSKNETK